MLEERLENHGYRKSKFIPGLWTYNWRPIYFTSVVENFGVKHVEKKMLIIWLVYWNNIMMSLNTGKASAILYSFLTGTMYSDMCIYTGRNTLLMPSSVSSVKIPRSGKLRPTSTPISCKLWKPYCIMDVPCTAPCLSPWAQPDQERPTKSTMETVD